MKKKKVIKVLKKIKKYCKRHPCGKCKYIRICQECLIGVPAGRNLKRSNL